VAQVLLLRLLMVWRLLTAVAGVGALVVTSEARPVIGLHHASSTADAGSVVAAVDAGTADAVGASASLENERLRAELEQLRQRTNALEQEAEAARIQSLALGDVADRLAEMQASLDAQQQSTRASAQQEADARVAVANIFAAERALATGDTNVGTIVDDNQLSLLPIPAQQDLSLALGALANEDLAIARDYLLQAIIDAQLRR
jgi:hypothetical protein